MLVTDIRQTFSLKHLLSKNAHKSHEPFGGGREGEEEEEAGSEANLLTSLR